MTSCKQVVKGIHLSKCCVCPVSVPVQIWLKYFMQFQFVSILSFERTERSETDLCMAFLHCTSETLAFHSKIRNECVPGRWCKQTHAHNHAHIYAVVHSVVYFKFINSMSKMSGDWRRLIFKQVSGKRNKKQERERSRTFYNWFALYMLRNFRIS